ncbi:MAG: hypothetical protein ABI830_02750 [Pseudolabrys sp.]
MADKIALGRIGLMLGAAAMVVLMIGTSVVTDHLAGRLHFDDGLSAVAQPAAMR